MRSWIFRHLPRLVRIQARRPGAELRGRLVRGPHGIELLPLPRRSLPCSR